MSTISRERLERAARIYATNDAASQALGIHTATFGRLCKRYRIVSPCERRRRNTSDEYDDDEYEEEYDDRSMSYASSSRTAQFVKRCTNFTWHVKQFIVYCVSY